MGVGKTTAVRVRSFCVAVVHVRTGCSINEIGQIKRLKGSSLPIRTWISYVELDYINAPKQFSPKNAVRQPFDPDRGQAFEYAVLGDRFIMAGSLVQLPFIFNKLCRINQRRYAPLEFHSSVDLIGTGTDHLKDYKLKESYLMNPGNEFCQHLQDIQKERENSVSVYFNKKNLLHSDGREKLPEISLRWHSNLEGMLGFIQQADTENK